jgi:hypothetical protein
MYFDTWLYIDVFRHLTSYWCILVNFSVTDVYIFAFLLYTIYFCAVFSKKIQIENIPVEHHFYCQWRTLSVAHLNWVRRRYYAWRTPLRCATDRTHNRGACGRAPLVINTSGLICVAHHRCATEAQIGAPHIRVFLVVFLLYGVFLKKMFGYAFLCRYLNYRCFQVPKGSSVRKGPRTVEDAFVGTGERSTNKISGSCYFDFHDVLFQGLCQYLWFAVQFLVVQQGREKSHVGLRERTWRCLNIMGHGFLRLQLSSVSLTSLEY